MKKIEIPSIPITIFKFKVGIQKNLLTNWKVPKDLLKKNHKNKEIIKVTHEICNAKDLIKCWLEKEVTAKPIDPSKGNIIITNNKFWISNITN